MSSCQTFSWTLIFSSSQTCPPKWQFLSSAPKPPRSSLKPQPHPPNPPQAPRNRNHTSAQGLLRTPRTARDSADSGLEAINASLEGLALPIHCLSHLTPLETPAPVTRKQPPETSCITPRWLLGENKPLRRHAQHRAG